MTTRRGFLGAMLAACAAPAIVRADSLMKIVVPSQGLILLDKWYTPPEFTITARPFISVDDLLEQGEGGSWNAGTNDPPLQLLTGEIGFYQGMTFIESRFDGSPAELQALVSRQDRRDKKQQQVNPLQRLRDKARMKIRS